MNKPEEAFDEENYNILMMWKGFQSFLTTTRLTKYQLSLTNSMLETFYDVITSNFSLNDPEIKQGFIILTLKDLINNNIDAAKLLHDFDHITDEIDSRAILRKVFSHIIKIVKKNKLEKYLTQLGTCNKEVVLEAKILFQEMLSLLLQKVLGKINNSDVLIEKYLEYLSLNVASKDWMFTPDNYEKEMDELLERIKEGAKQFPSLVKAITEENAIVFKNIVPDEYQKIAEQKLTSFDDPLYINSIKQISILFPKIMKEIQEFTTIREALFQQNYSDLQKYYQLQEYIVGYRFNFCLGSNDIKLILKEFQSKNENIKEDLQSLMSIDDMATEQLLSLRSRVVNLYSEFFTAVATVEQFYVMDQYRKEFFSFLFSILGNASLEICKKTENNPSPLTPKALLATYCIKEVAGSNVALMQLGFAAALQGVKMTDIYLPYFPSHERLQKEFQGVDFESLRSLLNIPAEVGITPYLQKLMEFGQKLLPRLTDSNLPKSSDATLLNSYSALFSDYRYDSSSSDSDNSDSDEEEISCQNNL